MTQKPPARACGGVWLGDAATRGKESMDSVWRIQACQFFAGLEEAIAMNVQIDSEYTIPLTEAELADLGRFFALKRGS
jgi:hypothetical protein